MQSTIFNFQNRLATHQARTGQNLLEALELKTSIQRADSFLAASNIRDYSRLQLIIEVLQRFCRILSEARQEGLPEPVQSYCEEPSGKQIYRLSAGDVPGELASDSLQSPDDPEATYRKKGGQPSRGQVIHVAESAHPDNQLNLITDVAVAANTSDDAAILAGRAETTSEKPPRCGRTSRRWRLWKR